MRYRIGHRIVILIALAICICNAHPPVLSTGNDPAFASPSVQAPQRTLGHGAFIRPHYPGSVYFDYEGVQEFAPGTFPHNDEITSIYSDLDFEKCETIDETKIDRVPYTILANCRGVAGYALELLEVDSRQSINVVFPNGERHALEFLKVVSPAFSSVGAKAEWRVTKNNDRVEPIALIVRLNVDKSVEDPERGTYVSYLTASKITGTLACVTDVVKPAPNQNILARQLADSSRDRPCLPEYPWLPKGDL